MYRATGVLHGTESGPLQEVPLTEESELRRSLHPYPAESMQLLRKIFPWVTDDYDKIPAERIVMNDPDTFGQCQVHGSESMSAIPNALAGATLIRGDALFPQSLYEALEGIADADYLIHSMSAGEAGFEERDLRAARNFAAAAKQAGVGRLSIWEV